jgi:hypothetical protein
MRITALVSNLLATAGVLVAGASAAQTYTFQQGLNGYAGTRDTMLAQSEPALALGGQDFVSIDASDGGLPNHGLLAFGGLFGTGAGQIKPTESIVSARLQLQIDSAGSGFTLHNMLIDWSEATATWNSFGGGIQANGIEAETTPFLSLGGNNGDSNVSEGLLTLDVTASLRRVQAGSVPGYGWAFLPFMPDGTNGVDFFSREYFATADRPRLIVEVTPVPEPQTWLLLIAGLAGATAMARRARPARR